MENRKWKIMKKSNKNQMNEISISNTLPPLSSLQTICDGIYYDSSVSRRINYILNYGTPWQGYSNAGIITVDSFQA